MTLHRIVAACSAIGVLISAYALSIHYGASGGNICSVSTIFSCDLVNRGPWSAIGGIPVAGIGLIGYTSLFLLLLRRPAGWKSWFLSGTIAGFLFSLYLTYLEAFVIRSFCLVCLASLADVTILMVLGIILFRQGR